MEKIIKTRKRKAFRILIITLVLAGVLTGFFTTELKQVLSVFKTNSSTLVTNYPEFAELLEEKDTVRVELPYLEDSGIWYGTESNIKQSFGISFLDEKFVVILQDGKPEAMRLFEYPETVMLTTDTSPTSRRALAMMVDDYAEYFEISKEEAAQYLHPNVMRLEGIRSNTYLYLGSLASLLILGIGYYIYRSNKALKDLTKNFSAEEMDRLDYEINNPVFENKAVIITKSFVIALGQTKVNRQFLAIQDIDWVYKNVTTHRTNGIKTGTTYQVKVFTTGNKGCVDIQMKEREVDDVLEVLDGMSNKMLIGYFDGGLQVWKKAQSYSGLLSGLGFVERPEASETEATEDVEDKKPEETPEEVTEEVIKTVEEPEDF